jgi:hypothetical protein
MADHFGMQPLRWMRVAHDHAVSLSLGSMPSCRWSRLRSTSVCSRGAINGTIGPQASWPIPRAQWSYAVGERLIGAPMLSLCQIAAVRASTRCQMRTMTPAGAWPPWVSEVELAFEGVVDRLKSPPPTNQISVAVDSLGAHANNRQRDGLTPVTV